MSNRDFAQSHDGLRIRYEVRGAGEPLALIMGFSGSGRAWGEPFLSRLEKRFRLVVIDNRGTGESDQPDRSWTLGDMASDVARVLDRARIDRAHIYGISMGGMIAQEFALHHQEKLSCLILGCTHFGGASVAQSPPEIVAAVMAGTNATPAQQHQQLQAVFCDDTIANRREVVEKHNRIRAQYPIPPYAFLRQTQAIGVFDARARLNQIRVPTMVITGREDRLVAPQNSKLIAERIPGSKLVELPGGHLFMAEYPEQFNRAVIDFIDAHR